MKILMMTNTYAPIVGGLEKSIQVFSEQFRLKGHEVKIVAPEFEKMPAHEKDVIRVPSLEKFIGTDFSVGLPLPEVIQDLVDQFKPDIVHSHHPFLMGDLALRICGQNKLPLVFTYHTMFEHYTNFFGLENPAMQKFVVEIATGYANMVDQIIVPSDSVARVLAERKVQTPIAIVPTGLDVARFKPAPSNFRSKYKIPAKAFVVGHVGRLSPEKNLMFLTESTADFLKENKNAHFLIIGSGPSEREMKKHLKAWGVLNRAHFAGIHKGKSLVDAYHAMDIFAFASKSETQGMVITEAMAAGLPVVALDAPGVREVVTDKLNGRLLMEESRKKFAQALAWCATRPTGKWHAIQKQALDTAEKFSLEACAQKALRVYEVVRMNHVVPTEEHWGGWQALVGRFKTELGLLFNLGKAAGSAVVQAAVTESPVKERIDSIYHQKIKDAVDAWTISLKKLRKENQISHGEEKTQPENTIESIAQKIRTYETELAELNRKIIQACDDFEKFLTDAQDDLKKDFGETGK